MNDSADYSPPKVWKWETQSNGVFSKINRPIAGATHKTTLAIGEQPMQLYCKGTANSLKITVMLEELLATGQTGAAYDKHDIDIFEGDQFGSGFVDINPNSKIPALVDRSTATPVNIFESGAILVYLAEKFDAFLPTTPAARAECLSWLFWQVGSAPFLGGGFGHFYKYAPVKLEYPINRYTMEVKRQLDVLDRHLAENEYMANGEYTIADMSIWPWYFALIFENGYDAAEFLDVESYQHVIRWASQIGERTGAQRGYRYRSS